MKSFANATPPNKLTEVVCSAAGCEEKVTVNNCRTGKQNFCPAHRKVSRAEGQQGGKRRSPSVPIPAGRKEAWRVAHDPTGLFRNNVRSLAGWVETLRDKKFAGVILISKDTNQCLRGELAGSLVVLQPYTPEQTEAKQENGQSVVTTWQSRGTKLEGKKL